MSDEDLVSYVLASLRAAHGLTPKELADRTGFDEARITRWETGREEPSVDVLNTLLGHLKTTPTEFFKLQSLLLRIIERPDSFAEGIEESLERHARRDSKAPPASRSRQGRIGGWAGSAAEGAAPARPSAPRRSARGTVVEGIAQAMRDRVERGTKADPEGEEQEIGPLAQEVDLLAKETARLVESHVRLFYRALAGAAGSTVAEEADEGD